VQRRSGSRAGEPQPETKGPWENEGYRHDKYQVEVKAEFEPPSFDPLPVLMEEAEGEEQTELALSERDADPACALTASECEGSQSKDYFAGPQSLNPDEEDVRRAFSLCTRTLMDPDPKVHQRALEACDSAMRRLAFLNAMGKCCVDMNDGGPDRGRDHQAA